jgi:site-specific DNA-methyltransferase (adenine-specific)
MIEIKHGDCLDVLRTLADNSVDSIVTDPPYGLSFMGKKWDYDVPAVDVWAECLRVLKPGGHLLAFAGTRTQHRMAVRIEDAGFEIRDMIAWVYGSGFPKSLDVSKAIDKMDAVDEPRARRLRSKNMAARAVIGHREQGFAPGTNEVFGEFSGDTRITAPATPAAIQWQGWGTALKPALEPITVARKPLIGTVASNVLAWGTGAINVDGGRVGTSKDVPSSPSTTGQWFGADGENGTESGHNPNIGRFPANLIHDGSDEVVGLFPDQTSGANPTSRGGLGFHGANGQDSCDAPRGQDSGSAARFFYCAKASADDRDDGCSALPPKSAGEATGGRAEGSAGLDSPRAGAGRSREASGNHHPTVKPTDLMRYLCRLVTPPGGLVLDPFVGSGSTGRGAVLEGFDFIGIEREAEYVEIARARITAAIKQRHKDTAQGSLF